jgi:hypothetical protein
MNSPRSGFRRAAIASWALAGLGVAGVAGTSVLAYGDTLKPVAADAPAAIEPAAAETAVNLDPGPITPAPALAQEIPAPVVAPEPTQAYTPAPAYTAPPAPQYTQTYAPAPAQTYEPAPAYTAPAQSAPSGPVGGQGTISVTKPTTGSSSSGSSSTTKTHISMGGSGSGPNKAVPHTVSKGS